MPIDGCNHTFKHLANVVLPEYMTKIRQMIRQPLQMQTFAKESHGPRTCAKHLGLLGDFSGCYVLIENGKPIYVGISRGVLARLIQHVRGKTHFDASLAYRVATQRQPHGLQRSAAMKDETFRLAFESARNYLRLLEVAFVKIDCPVELYAFELYCAMELDCGEWNTFKTH